MNVRREDPRLEEEEMNPEDWKQIQKKIDSQYEKKLKEVSDDAMNKLQAFQKEHNQLLQKTQYLLDNSQIKSRDDSFVEEIEPDRQSFMTQQNPKQDRNRFFSPIIKEKSFQEPIYEKTDPQVIRQLH
jgi:CHAD domain-containing protein